MSNLPEWMWKTTGAFATLAIEILRLYDQPAAQWMYQVKIAGFDFFFCDLPSS